MVMNLGQIQPVHYETEYDELDAPYVAEVIAEVAEMFDVAVEVLMGLGELEYEHQEEEVELELGSTVAVESAEAAALYLEVVFQLVVEALLKVQLKAKNICIVIF